MLVTMLNHRLKIFISYSREVDWEEALWLYDLLHHSIKQCTLSHLWVTCCFTLNEESFFLSLTSVRFYFVSLLRSTLRLYPCYLSLFFSFFCLPLSTWYSLHFCLLFQKVCFVFLINNYLIYYFPFLHFSSF